MDQGVHFLVISYSKPSVMVEKLLLYSSVSLGDWEGPWNSNSVKGASIMSSLRPERPHSGRLRKSFISIKEPTAIYTNSC